MILMVGRKQARIIPLGKDLAKRAMVTKTFLVVLIFSAFAAAALASQWSDDWEGIRRASEGVKTIQSDFVQKKTMKILAHPLVSKGRFFYRAPDSLRWEYQSPIESVLVVDQGKARRFFKHGDAFEEDAGASVEAVRIVVDQIIDWIGGRYNKNASFAPELVPGSPTKITMTAKDPSLSRFIQRIEVVLSDTPGVIQSVKIIESADASTLIEFSGVKLNSPLPEDVFRKVP